MRNRKRWIAAMLVIAMTVSDCGVIPAFATEGNMAAETSVSENNAVSGETPADAAPDSGSEMNEGVKEGISSGESVQSGEAADSAQDGDKEAAAMQDKDTGVTGSGTDTPLELPAIHIGQIIKGEELPDPNDLKFEYDLPVSFEASDSLILFANYDIDAIPGQEENGTLVWSILRGEKGTAAGSTGLIKEEDDWKDFEIVSDSPYFTMTENEDEESGYYRMIELTSEETAGQNDYDYYIRAAYYFGTKEDMDEAFYTAATVPFVPQNDDTDIGQARDDTVDTEKADNDMTKDDMPAVEDMDQKTAGDDVLAEDSDEEELPEDSSAGNSETDETTEEISTISENDMTDEVSALSESDPVQPVAEEHISKIILDKTELTIQPGSTGQLTATTLPENIQAKISWDSSNERVATVNETGEVRAKAEGITYITAECDGLTAVAKVEVAPENAGDKLLDLSGDIWVAGFKRESEDFVYTGQKITQDIRVYYKNTLLTEKTDYTLAYKNNINAAVYNTAKAPSVTINLKGQYSGSVTLYYTIHPLDLNAIDIYNADNGGVDGTGAAGSRSPGYEQTVAYGKNLKIPNPVLTFGKKKLAANKDFVCDYTPLSEQLNAEHGQTADYKKGDSYTPGKVYSYTVNGIGNFAGSFQMQLVILKDKTLNFSSASVKLDQKQYEFHGTALSKSEVKIAELKVSGQVLDDALYDYEVCAGGTEGAYVTVYPSEAGRAAGYRGSKKVNLKLVGDRKIADAAPGENWKDSIPFSQKTVNKNGGIYQEKTGVLVYGEGEAKETLTEGEDYTVKYSNAKKAGKVTVTFTGKGRYKGTLKKKYEITPNRDENNLAIVWGKNVKDKDGTLEVTYQKGGAVPDFVIKDQDRNILKNKTDYTVKYKDNKTPGTSMSCEITGKGNYKGYTRNVQLQVMPGDISLASISIPDKPYSTKQNAWKSTAVIKDVNGKKLAAGTDYVKELTYTYENMVSGQPPQKGTAVTVTVQGMGCYEGSVLEGSYRIFEKNISKLKVVIDPQEYTGEEVTLLPGNIHVYANSTDAKKKQNELPSSCYEIVGYSNNIKAGTAKVTLRGKEEYGGTKAYSFKIQKRAYRINRVKGIAFDKTSLSVLLAEPDEAKRTIMATITAQTEEPIANPTVIFTVSDRRIADIETRIIDDTKISVVIMLKKEGNVTITATTQDGNKKAQCKVKIVDAPILKQEGQKIEGEVGQTYQLELEKAEWQDIDVNAIKWESNNPDVVSVTKDGLLGTLSMKKLGAAVIKVTYHGYVQQCYAIVIGEETLPEGRVLTYNQQPGCTDDTPHINKLLREWEWDYPDSYDYMYLPAGVYWIDPTDGGYDQFGKYKFGGIILTDNQKLIMSPSALLMTIPNSKPGYHVIWAFGRENITISGGQIIGDRREHKGKGGEYGHGIHISGCTNVTIEDVEISQCWGDGIYLGYYADQKKRSNHVTITNCNLHNNRRNNLSITDASNITIDHCKFNYAKGTDPQYGIDIEPNENKPCEHVKILNSEFKGNAKASMGIIKSANDIRLENCTLDGNFYNMAGRNVVLKNTTVGGNIEGTVRRE